jgi:16S rRNA (adenine1518-N6/adenine1519-N6)-dimethyltransferase
MSAPHDQHFLTDPDAVRKIASFTDIKNKTVLEIGPGKGVLTNELLERGAKVIAIEIDPKMIEILGSRFRNEIDSGRLVLINKDAVRCEYPDFDIVVANLPYSASSKITFRLLEHGFKEAVLMYQKEFAARMMALPGTSDCGRLSVMVQTYAKVMPLLNLPPGSFSPPPAVDSMVVRITMKDELTYPVDDPEFYSILVRELFSHRRKTLKKSLKSSRTIIGEEKYEKIIDMLSDEMLKKRAEELTLKDFSDISNIATA